MASNRGTTSGEGALRAMGATTPQVWIIDDETSVRERLYDALTQKGYAVTTVGSGMQALEMLKARRPQLIVLDSMTPELSGVETAKETHAFDDGVTIVLLR